MSHKSYQNLVTETYCDNAIRSVMMVDDDFISYPNLIALLNSKDEVSINKINASKQAASLVNFFQSKNMLCDIDNGEAPDFLEVNRLRKSDLIIIDYHLENNSPEKTLSILSKLRESKQMNMVVVYTNEKLDNVFMSILAKFHGIKNINDLIIDEDCEELSTYWQDILISDIKARTNIYPSIEETIDYITTRNIKTTKGKLFSRADFNQNIELRNRADLIAKIILEYSVAAILPSSVLDNEHTSFTIEHGRNGSMWIKSNNVFITLFNKSTANDDSQDIWNQLNSSLHSWEPSYYNIIRSEIQNEIYSDSLAFSINLDNDNYGQAALLNEILKNNDPLYLKNNINAIYQNIAEEFLLKLSSNTDLQNFIFTTINHYHSELESAMKEGAAVEAVATRQRIDYCATKLNIASDPKHHLNMYHALNMNLSSRNYEEQYISTGTVLFDSENSDWFLCVSAACDMVPSQGNDAYHKRLNPHRLIRVMRLFQVNDNDAVTEAENSKYIYTYDHNTRRCFSVLTPESGLPKIDYFIILNHATYSGERFANAVFLKSSADGTSIEHEGIKLKLKSQLRTGYAERFQLIANNHSGRIGVDYVSAEKF
ncbi:response regulator receiver domain [Aeromonas caviae]|uniref:response regulator receiver domain n=1 Tax=Aeromonas caviae TaxID=648 RepID=UPI003F742EBD